MIFTDLRLLVPSVCCWVSFFAVPPARRAAVLAAWGTAFYVTHAAAWTVPALAPATGSPSTW